MAKAELAPTKALAAKLAYAALTILRDNDKQMPMRELMDRVENQVELSDWERERYEKTGYVRWQSVLHFYSIDCVKAGYLVKKEGLWYLTPEGEEALKLGPVRLLESAQKAYRQWKSQQPAPSPEKPVEEEVEEGGITLEQAEQIAREGLEGQVAKMNPYEFQDLVAALLRGMGYYTPFVAPKGKDGGIDIVAYRDPLGTESPRIQVQIKHRESSATVQEVRQLMGLLQKQGDVGLFVATAGFTTDAKATARSSHVHVELVDLSRFINLWQKFYGKLPDEDKALLPMTPIYFLAKLE
jgi:restriction system protein